MKSRFWMSLLLAGASCLITSHASLATTTSLISVADNFGLGDSTGTIVGLGPDANPNVDAYTQIGTGSRTFAIEFDLATLPGDHTLISSAILQLTPLSFVNMAHTIDVNGYAGNGTIELADVDGSNNIGLLHAGVPMTAVGTMDVTSFIQSRVAAGSTHAGFMATSPDPLTSPGGSHPHVYSREWPNVAERPTLIVTTIPEPSASALITLALAAMGLRLRSD